MTIGSVELRRSELGTQFERNRRKEGDKSRVTSDASEVRVGVVGVGHIGTPLIAACLDVGYTVLACDTDASRFDALRDNMLDRPDFCAHGTRDFAQDCRLRFSTSHAILDAAKIICICVPTPLNKQRLPDLVPLKTAVRNTLPHIQPGALLVLESTSYPGTTRELIAPLIEQVGLKVGEDVFLAYAPSREDPGNQAFSVRSTPRIVGAPDDASRERAAAFYEAICGQVHRASSWEVAEAAKLVENAFRATNIALINELKILFADMGIDIWEVIAAASTKPFGYTPFYPGPGFGGHCIPIDPIYLSWKAREYGSQCAVLEAALHSNRRTRDFIVENTVKALRINKSVSDRPSSVLIVGVSYKANVADARESPAFEIAKALISYGIRVYFHDPLVKSLSRPESDYFCSTASVPISPDSLNIFDAALVLTDHDCVDWVQVCRSAKILIDTRNRLSEADCSGRPLIRS